MEALLAACAAVGVPLSRADLDEIVTTSDKQRFGFDETRTRIRANQGHSVDVDLQLTPAAPPDMLFHGTGERAVEAILREGLLRMERHHVHLSADEATARTVGTRHGRPVVFVVDAAGMHRAGVVFHRSENGVWLVDAVAPSWLRRLG